MLDSDWDGKSKKRLMPKALALRIIDECAAIGAPALKFNFRGESVIHPDYGEIVGYARGKIHDPEGWARRGCAASLRAGEYKFHDLLANTNGNIPPALWESSIRGLMACTKVMVSLDSMDPAIYPKVRVGLSLESAQKTISELVKRGHPGLWVRRVVCKDNKDEDFARAVYARWPSGVRVSEHYAFDRNHYQQQELGVEDHSKWERQFCGYPSQRVVIEASGSYSPCCISWEGEFYKTGLPGRYPEMGIMEYWNSAWRKQLVSELRQNIFTNDKCKNCTTFMAFRRPEREFVKDVEVVEVSEKA